MLNNNNLLEGIGRIINDKEEDIVIIIFNAGSDTSQKLNNIAAYQKNPIEVHNAWMKSEAHKENILNGRFSELGIGVYIDNAGEVYWAETFVGHQ